MHATGHTHKTHLSVAKSNAASVDKAPPWGTQCCTKAALHYAYPLQANRPQHHAPGCALLCTASMVDEVLRVLLGPAVHGGLVVHVDTLLENPVHGTGNVLERPYSPPIRASTHIPPYARASAHKYCACTLLAL